jgi:hypothetical protein
MSNNKSKIIITVFMLAMSTMIQGFRASCQDIELLSKLSDLSVFYNRLIFDWQDTRFFLVDKRNNLDPVLPDIGFSCILGSFGPVEKKGLLREASNPLGYSASSDVFTERTGIAPDISLDSSKDTYAMLSPVPEILSLYAIWRDGAITHSGGIVSLPIADKSFLELSGSLSTPSKPQAAETWYLDKNLYSGGAVYTAGGRAALSIGILSVNSSLVFSGNEYYEPGFFSLSGIGLESGIVTLKTLFGYCSDTYITPDCSFIDKMIQAEALLEVTPTKLITCTLGCCMNLDRPLLRPAGFLSGNENCSAKIEASFPFGRDTQIGFAANGCYEGVFDEHGSDKKNVNAGLTISGEAGAFNASAGIDSDFTDFELKGAKSKCSLGFDFASHSLSITCSAGLFPDLAISGKLMYMYTFGLSDFFVTLSTKKQFEPASDSWNGFTSRPFDFLLLTIGFETKKKAGS